MEQTTTSELVIQKDEIDGVEVFSAFGDLIISTAKGLLGKAEESILEEKSKIVFNLTLIDFMDKFGIGIVVKTCQEIKKENGKFAIILNPVLSELFKKCRLDDYVKIFICGEGDDLAEKEKEAVNWVRS